MNPTAAPHAPSPATAPTAATRYGAQALSPRERVVLSNISEDITLEEVATLLWVTRNTVKSQLRSVYKKIGVSTRADAVAWAKAAGIS